MVILIILLLLLAGSLAALTFMTFRYKKILEKENEKPTQVINKIITIDDKCEKKGTDCADEDRMNLNSQ